LELLSINFPKIRTRFSVKKYPRNLEITLRRLRFHSKFFRIKISSVVRSPHITKRVEETGHSKRLINLEIYRNPSKMCLFSLLSVIVLYFSFYRSLFFSNELESFPINVLTHIRNDAKNVHLVCFEGERV